NDDLDVLVVDGYTLSTVNSLNRINDVLFHATTTENLKYVVWICCTAHQAKTGGDMVTVAQGALDHRIRVGLHRATNLSQALTLRQLHVDNIVRTIVWGNDQGTEDTLLGHQPGSND